MKKISKNEQYRSELIDIFSEAARNQGLLDRFIKDILTPKEYKEVAKRWQIVKLLRAGETQRYIEKTLHTGIATVTRGSRALLNPEGGFNELLKKRKTKKEILI
jgi:TrpR family transcriptional regulator, trp operon repressor